MYFRYLKHSLALLISLLIALIAYYCFQIYVDLSICESNEPKSGLCSDEVKRAMLKMGPKYYYIMKGEKLYVNKGDGKWLMLKY